MDRLVRPMKYTRYITQYNVIYYRKGYSVPRFISPSVEFLFG